MMCRARGPRGRAFVDFPEPMLRSTGISRPSRMAKLHLITYGCQMNEYDSERVAGLLRQNRW
jgi:hypothetical protein